MGNRRKINSHHLHCRPRLYQGQGACFGLKMLTSSLQHFITVK